MKTKKKTKYAKDDGRVIADMNMEGMPWYVKNKSPEDDNTAPREPLTRKETMIMIFNAILAVLLIGLVFIASAFLFIQFCIHIWLR